MSRSPNVFTVVLSAVALPYAYRLPAILACVEGDSWHVWTNVRLSTTIQHHLAGRGFHVRTDGWGP